MPVNPYDDRKVSLRRPRGNGDLDIVRASYTRRKANVTEALASESIFAFAPQISLINSASHQIPKYISHFSLKCMFHSVVFKNN